MALNEALESKYVRFDGSGDLVGTIWQDRPPMERRAGLGAGGLLCRAETRRKRSEKLREKMSQARATVRGILTSLDDIAWLLNIRRGKWDGVVWSGGVGLCDGV